MRIRCLISFYSAAVFARLVSLPVPRHILLHADWPNELTPRALKTRWRRITDCLKRDRYRRLLQPAYHRPRTICFA